MDHELTEEERRVERENAIRAASALQAKAVWWMILVPALLAVGLGAVWSYLSASMAAGLIVASVATSLGNAISTAIRTEWD